MISNSLSSDCAEQHESQYNPLSRQQNVVLLIAIREMNMNKVRAMHHRVVMRSRYENLMSGLENLIPSMASDNGAYLDGGMHDIGGSAKCVIHSGCLRHILTFVNRASTFFTWILSLLEALSAL
jgi:hypothetical protein